MSWVWKPGKDDSRPPDWEGNWETRKWRLDSYDYWWEWQPGKDDSQPPDLRGDWETRKWVRVSQSPDLAWWNSFYDSIRKYDYEG